MFVCRTFGNTNVSYQLGGHSNYSENFIVKYLIPTLTLLLLLFGLLTLAGSIRGGISFYLPILTISTFVGVIAYLSDKRFGLKIILIVSIAWLLRYFERSIFLSLYDPQNLGRWTLVVPIILVTIPLFFLSYNYRQRLLKKRSNLKRLTILFLFIPSLTFLSFIRKPHTNEFNCWYYINQSDSSYKITFAITPEHLFEVYSNFKELREFVEKNGIKDEYRAGLYCPETKVEIITRFKKITSISIVGFHNTTINNYYYLPKKVNIDYKQIKGDKSILEPDFEL